MLVHETTSLAFRNPQAFARSQDVRRTSAERRSEARVDVTRGLLARVASRFDVALDRFSDRIGGRVARKVIVVTIGWAVLALGVALFALPAASLILLLGLAILSTEYRWAHAILRWIGEQKTRARALAARAGRAVERIARRAVGVARRPGPRLVG
jgi:hypothetical protein